MSHVDNAQFRALLGGIGGIAMMDEAIFPNVKEREIVEIKVITLCLNGKTGVERWTIKHDGNQTAAYLVKLIPDFRGNTHTTIEQDKANDSNETTGRSMLK